MDRISAVFIIGIISLVMISSYIVYDTWIAPDDMEYEVLIFNDDTSVTNNSDSSLWIRARVDTEATSNDMVMELEINDNSWIDGEDGWYYYTESLGAKRKTEPFARSDEGLNAKHAAVGTFKVKVEAVEQTMLPKIPDDGREAFLLLKRERQAAEPIFL